MRSVRWDISVSPDVDRTVRAFLAAQGDDRDSDLSSFIEEAVRAHILELSAEQAKVANANLTEEELSDYVNEAVEWARSR